MKKKKTKKNKQINNEIFRQYFEYQNASFLAKYLNKTNQVKNE